MPISLTVWAAEGGWITKQILKEVIMRNKWKTKVKRQAENDYSSQFSVCLLILIFCLSLNLKKQWV